MNQPVTVKSGNGEKPKTSNGATFVPTGLLGARKRGLTFDGFGVAGLGDLTGWNATPLSFAEVPAEAHPMTPFPAKPMAVKPAPAVPQMQKGLTSTTIQPARQTPGSFPESKPGAVPVYPSPLPNSVVPEPAVRFRGAGRMVQSPQPVSPQDPIPLPATSGTPGLPVHESNGKSPALLIQPLKSRTAALPERPELPESHLRTAQPQGQFQPQAFATPSFEPKDEVSSVRSLVSEIRFANRSNADDVRFSFDSKSLPGVNVEITRDRSTGEMSIILSAQSAAVAAKLGGYVPQIMASMKAQGVPVGSIRTERRSSSSSSGGSRSGGGNSGSGKGKRG